MACARVGCPWPWRTPSTWTRRCGRACTTWPCCASSVVRRTRPRRRCLLAAMTSPSTPRWRRCWRPGQVRARNSSCGTWPRNCRCIAGWAGWRGRWPTRAWSGAACPDIVRWRPDSAPASVFPLTCARRWRTRMSAGTARATRTVWRARRCRSPCGSWARPVMPSCGPGPAGTPPARCLPIGAAAPTTPPSSTRWSLAGSGGWMRSVTTRAQPSCTPSQVQRARSPRTTWTPRWRRWPTSRTSSRRTSGATRQGSPPSPPTRDGRPVSPTRTRSRSVVPGWSTTSGRWVFPAGSGTTLALLARTSGSGSGCTPISPSGSSVVAGCCGRSPSSPRAITSAPTAPATTAVSLRTRCRWPPACWPQRTPTTPC